MSEAVHIDMYKASVPVVLNALTNLKAILGKAEAWAAEKNVKEATVLNARLALDMLPFSKQIQLVSDTAKGIAARLGGVENPAYADDEATFAELHSRLQKTVDFVRSVDAKGFEGSETREVVLKFPSRTMEFTGLSYLTGFAIPNLFFHVTTAYAILRHSGVPLGKNDFLGG
ncbi:DUF1993 domain-containing protein [Asticcacaulis benevestitus]|uniref:DUF1993 domain-containing protein n=1 Tax=Asticcacaulis benevestitus DSM 16100 = ATCC BAA-896 TaxID=1121022 RepID=V4PJM2_9CAUL|nr:DUF1993 domain-containing protein [Asticcacaulis benevestitus]ESQ94152.1 hypothetical protein ABENE_03410 [Asticcacaulis benevestitus DSM 16100 = ATCC BAA-896]